MYRLTFIIDTLIFYVLSIITKLSELNHSVGIGELELVSYIILNLLRVIKPSKTQ